MDAKLHEILSLECFKNSEIIASKKALNNTVEDVFIMEVPDIRNYISKNGILLTTLYPIMNNEKALRDFIPMLSEVGISALAIKPGRYIKEIPKYMFDQAKKRDLPIIVLDDGVNFSTIANSVLETLLHARNDELRLREEIFEELRSMLLEEADFDRFSKYIEKKTGLKSIITDSELEFVVSTNKFNFKEKALSAIQDSNYNSEQEVFNDSKRVYKREDIVVREIAAHKTIFGYIIAIKNDNYDRGLLNVVLNQSAIILAFMFQKRISLIELERKYFEEFVRSIVSGTFNSEREIVNKAKIFSWNIAFPLYILEVESNKYDRKLERTIVEQIVSNTSLKKKEVITALYNDILLVFINYIDEDLDKVLERLSQELSLRIYSSNLIGGFRDLNRGFEEVNLTRKIFSKSKERYFYKSYLNLGVYRIFHLVEDRKKLREYVDLKLEIFKGNAELINTIKVLSENNFHLKNTSKEMFLHLNTLRNRISKIKEIGLDLSDGRAIEEVVLAIRLKEYLDHM